MSAPGISGRARALQAGAVSVVALTAVLLSSHPNIALGALTMSLAAALLRRAIPVGLFGEIATCFLLLFVSAFVIFNLAPQSPLFGTNLVPRGSNTLGFALLIVASARLWLRSTHEKQQLRELPITLFLAMSSLAAWGAIYSRWLYPTSIALFLAFAIAGLRAADPGRAPLKLASPLHRRVAIAALLAAIAMAWVGTFVLPPIQSWVASRMLRQLPAQSGFSSYLHLGSMKGMLQSEKTVLRVHGEKSSYLRGLVYNGYRRGSWARRDPERAVLTVPTQLSGPNITEIEVVSQSNRYFTPLRTSELASSTGFVSRDDTGIYEPVTGDPAKRLWVRAGAPPEGEKDEPSSMEFHVPQRMLGSLRRLAEEWTSNAETPEAKLKALEERLRSEYRYSLDFKRSRAVDPVLDFLFVERSGHCEYFASALALLARSVGVASRVVTGYLVSEYNELGGYYIVREKNAHAWVEAFVGQTWQTYDATPADESFTSLPSETGKLPALFDWLSERWSRFMDWLLLRELHEVLGALVGATGLLAVVRWMRFRKERAQAALSVLNIDEPLPGWLSLERALEAKQLGKAPGETVDRWALRVKPRLPPPFDQELLELSAQYSGLRYGGQGDLNTLNQALEQLASQLKLWEPSGPSGFNQVAAHSAAAESTANGSNLSHYP